MNINKVVDEWVKTYFQDSIVKISIKLKSKELKKSLRKVIEDKIDKFIFPPCEKCGACFCIHVKKELKQRLLSEKEERV